MQDLVVKILPDIELAWRGDKPLLLLLMLLLLLLMVKTSACLSISFSLPTGSEVFFF